MTAKEMFKKEGYKLREDSNEFLIYNRRRGIYENIITFIKDRKHFTIYSYQKNNNETILRLAEINIKTNKAIQTQIEELGW